MKYFIRGERIVVYNSMLNSSCMINLNSILATYPEWGAESAPTFTILGRKAPSNIINKGSREKSLARKVAWRRR